MTFQERMASRCAGCTMRSRDVDCKECRKYWNRKWQAITADIKATKK